MKQQLSWTENRAFFDRMEAVRQKAAALMGMGDVTKSVTPKFGLLAPAKAGGTIATRYFMPWSTHPSMAVTGAQCLASCVLTPGTIADGMAAKSNETPANVILEHASGKIEVAVDYADTATGFEIKSAGLVRTARKIAAGEVFIPRSIWAGHEPRLRGDAAMKVHILDDWFDTLRGLPCFAKLADHEVTVWTDHEADPVKARCAFAGGRGLGALS